MPWVLFDSAIGKVLLKAGAVVALVLAVWWWWGAQLENAADDREREIRADVKEQVDKANRKVEQTNDRLDGIEATFEVISNTRDRAVVVAVEPHQERVQYEVENDPRYREFEYDDSVRDALNAQIAAVNDHLSASNPRDTGKAGAAD